MSRGRKASLGGVAERRGNGLQSRLHGFKSRLHLWFSARTISSAGERFPDTEEVTGSIPVSSTIHHGSNATAVSVPPQGLWRPFACSGVTAVAGPDTAPIRADP